MEGVANKKQIAIYELNDRYNAKGGEKVNTKGIFDNINIKDGNNNAQW